MLIGGPRYAISARIRQFFVGMFLPATSSCSNGEDRATMQFDLTRLAFALAAYRADRGTYRAKLAAWAQVRRGSPQGHLPRLGVALPAGGRGYLLYSVGINGKDDGGKGYDDRKGGENWDDLAVHVPAATARNSR